jgi:hypothetical protein
METTTTTKTTKRAKALTPTQEAIEWRAYEIWLHRGGTCGTELEDWLQAEQEMLTTKAARKAKAA